ncbi:acyl-CoA dehydrogenase [Rhizoctonia solani]|uniref:Acyl-CoA dehydrogenase n=1 Tax=Rhizoctonia solani TaxID=456999 RepID=A0A8H8NUA6_9AGAM|nr:acyl-CoA dehydrogenase [Rhizoctonia solani]QRW18892.1 acyl-CoA dehydrogenase [Rhizoctonia solani]
MAPQNISAQPTAAPAMEMTMQPTIEQAQCQNQKQGFAARIRGGGAGKDCLMGALACFLCCECFEGCCECFADIVAVHVKCAARTTYGYSFAEFTSPSTWAFIESKFTPFGKETLAKVVDFVQNECLPAEKIFHAQISTDPKLRWATTPQFKAHYPDVGVPLTNVEYAVMAEIMGRVGQLASESMNCSAPDTGNMEVFARYGTPEQKKKWLVPLMNGEIRSAFSMTERFIASSDATNIQTSIRREGDEIVINGGFLGPGDPRCRVHLVMGKSDPKNPSPYKQQSIVIVPADAPGVRVIRPMQVFGYDDAPEGHCEIIYENVRVPASNIIAGWGKGFEVIQGRLGPGRIHHCMRSIGIAQRALDLMLERVTDERKKPFGKVLAEHGTVVANIAKSRAEIEGARLLVLSAAHQIDQFKAKGALKEIGIAKFVVPGMALQVVDRAMQVHGAEGISQDTPLAKLWAGLRTLRYADGPDEVHMQQIGQRELKRAARIRELSAAAQRKEDQLWKAAGIKPKL